MQSLGPLGFGVVEGLGILKHGIWDSDFRV